MAYIELTTKKLDINRIIDSVVIPSCGAVSVFIGTTRNNFDGKTVIHLEYEAYDSMAEKEMMKISEEMKKKWPLGKVALVHRKGIVPVGEASVVVVASSEHRREAQEAVMFAIDSLKANVPIWKKEIYNNGDSDWKVNKECVWNNS